jgi:hypothetical protein
MAGASAPAVLFWGSALGGSSPGGAMPTVNNRGCFFGLAFIAAAAGSRPVGRIHFPLPRTSRAS